MRWSARFGAEVAPGGVVRSCGCRQDRAFARLRIAQWLEAGLVWPMVRVAAASRHGWSRRAPSSRRRGPPSSEVPLLFEAGLDQLLRTRRSRWCPRRRCASSGQPRAGTRRWRRARGAPASPGGEGAAWRRSWRATTAALRSWERQPVRHYLASLEMNRRIFATIAAIRRGSAGLRERAASVCIRRRERCAALSDARSSAKQAAQKKLDPALIAAVIYRGDQVFDPRPSPAGAEGLMQVLPATAYYLRPISGGTPLHGQRRCDPEHSTRLRQLLPALPASDHYGGDMRLCWRGRYRRCLDRTVDDGSRMRMRRGTHAANTESDPVPGDREMTCAACSPRRSNTGPRIRVSWGC